MSELVVNQEPELPLKVPIDMGTPESLVEVMKEQRSRYLQRISNAKNKLEQQMDQSGKLYT